MDQTELQQKIALYYSKLPPKAQEIFASMKWLETLKNISEKYALNNTQIETLGSQTTLVLLGIISIDEYEESLMKDLSLPPESAERMLIEINDLIVKPVRLEIIDAFNANVEALKEEEPEIEQISDERFKKLPPEIEKLVRESNYQITLYEIARNYGLNVTQIGNLEKTVTNLIAGSIEPNKFEDLLEDSLELPSEKISSLVNEINEKIFKKIREKIMGQSTSTVKIETENDTHLFQQHGIEIVPEKLELNGKVAPMLAQKLSEPVQMPIVKTEHTLENISKPSLNTPIPVSVKPKIPGADPYREVPE